MAPLLFCYIRVTYDPGNNELNIFEPAQEQGAAGGDGNCDALKNAIICLFFLLLLPLSIGVVVLTLRQRPNLTGKHSG